MAKKLVKWQLLSKSRDKNRQEYEKPWRNLSAGPKKITSQKKVETKESLFIEQFQNLANDQNNQTEAKTDKNDLGRRETLAKIIARHDNEPIKKNQFLRKLCLMNARI